MWPIKVNDDKSRGGFQNRDVGLSGFDGNYGPDYGPDYARYSDPPDFVADSILLEQLVLYLEKTFPDEVSNLEISVRNGFVLLKGIVSTSLLHHEIPDSILRHYRVSDVINGLKVKDPRY